MENRHFPVRIKDRDFCFSYDTGANYPSFFRRYREEIQSRTKPVSAKMGGVGGERTVVMHIRYTVTNLIGAPGFVDC